MLDIRAFALTSGFILGGTVFCVGILNMLYPPYGAEVLALFSSLYPVYDADGALLDWLLGAGIAMIDGVLGGAIFAWLYNTLRRRPSRQP